jgi:hypothetical protein
MEKSKSLEIAAAILGENFYFTKCSEPNNLEYDKENGCVVVFSRCDVIHGVADIGTVCTSLGLSCFSEWNKIKQRLEIIIC